MSTALMQIRTVHPFPARMAPELALASLEGLNANSIVLDPMSGSGTVLRQALALGHHAIGFDMDPLAVLMSRVSTTEIDPACVQTELIDLLAEADFVDLRTERLDWQDAETKAFIKYWFAQPQRRELARLAVVLARRRAANLGAKRRAAVDVLQIALSRIIVTKEQCASLARDTSHSRPHRVASTSSFKVREGFLRSVGLIVRRMDGVSPGARIRIDTGDARRMAITDNSVDAIMTSPPYLNAIDYMRGHRMSLVWLGYSIKELRTIRSTSVGAERGTDAEGAEITDIASAMCDCSQLSGRHSRMLNRYADDLRLMMRDAARVLRPGGTATYVVGNSCLKGVFIRNSDGVAHAGRFAGLTLIEERERNLPANSRYLPMTDAGTLSKRMCTETILRFTR
ncbi:DNA methyltransferase (plasmid) [Agrobacterium sp. rho-13.3]|uniref:DNA methyltransferase n=1 Tax=Agrobacterium sp. rho-13.3 TaxID=3072980 RepID=UPI002A0DC189|nr:DNA methyltransferase [Agrobacterium sp. rho-13.3]MDX8311542.1 DNA methyltransferase [Agrobacterium sp. rho-13.3]